MSRPSLLQRLLSHSPKALVAVAACAFLSLPAFAVSQVRIVRLSDVQGSVEINKNSGMGFERAFLNLPITQGTELRTLANGRAEIEFEDGSTLRLAPNTKVEFSTLGVDDASKRVTRVSIESGMAYVNWLGKDSVTLDFSHESIALDHAAHFRVDTSEDQSRVAVFKGDVSVEAPSGQIAVAKNKTASFDSADDKSTLANSVAEEPLDSWDRDANGYHDQYAKNSLDSPYAYGLSDLNYYGSFTNVSGYGTMWQPFFTGVGWDPFADGAWGWYPGMGYTFASAYPWGWLPYRYGNWMFVPAFGWMWQPGGWGSYLTVPAYAPSTLVHVTPLAAPNSGTKTVLVGRAAAISTLPAFTTEVKNGSAGLGIPRGSLDDMKGLSHQVARRGSAEIHPGPQFTATSPSRGFSFGEEGPISHSAPGLAHSASSSHSSGGTSAHK